MEKRTFRRFSFFGVFALVILTGLAVGVSHTTFAEGFPFFGHSWGHGHGHGFGHDFGHGHRAMERMMERLDLTDEQLLEVQAIHEIIAERMESRQGNRVDHVEALLARMAQGDMTEEEAQLVVDHHLEMLRSTAYDVSGHMVALLNSLDEEQRAMLIKHLEHLHGLWNGS